MTKTNIKETQRKKPHPKKEYLIPPTRDALKENVL
jgi:hypothetical protein